MSILKWMMGLLLLKGLEDDEIRRMEGIIKITEVISGECASSN